VLGAICTQRLLIFNFGYLKLRDLAKLWFFKLIMTKLSLKKSVMMSLKNVTKFFHFGFILIVLWRLAANYEVVEVLMMTSLSFS